MPYHVLIVEDHAETLAAIATFLAKNGLDVATATDVDEALKAIIARIPDVLDLDLMLPHVDGINFLDTMRSYLRWDAVPVIVVTAADDYMVDRAASRGVARILRKPIDFSELLAAITEIADRGGVKGP